MYMSYGFAMLALLFIGIFRADWHSFIFFLVFLLFAPLVLLAPLAIWLINFFQPCTPAYAIIWLLIGLPAVALALALSFFEYYLVWTVPLGGGLTLVGLRRL
jgi:hypothetical protein